jgi:adenylate cyclase
MINPVDRAVRAIAKRNSYALVWAQFGLEHVVVLGGMGLLRLYQPMSSSDFWLLVAISQALVALDNIVSIKLTRRMWRPVWAWEHGAHDQRSAVAAWRTLTTFPLEYVRRTRKYPLLFSYLPFVAFITYKLHLHWYSFFIIAVVGTSTLAVGGLIRYFSIEIVSRPVLEEVAKNLPSDFEIKEEALPLRWRLFAAAPVINIVTAIAVSGLAARGHHLQLSDLGFSWLIAVVVSLTVSLELVVLVARSVGSSLSDLQDATERVQSGDFSVRIPVVAADETGRLGQSFNRMVKGLDERERLREAFGAYVDPGLADRVLEEGSDFPGEEVEVSVLFLDIREFTAFSERAEPEKVVSLLTGFWELVVPELIKQHGHANKFIGDGLLGVFGAPERLDDHADRAALAACEIAKVVKERYEGEVEVGIGVNSGAVVAGTVGGGGRVEFTVIGDAVNTAARVEKATRQTGDTVLITDATRERLTREEFEFEERPPVALKGKREKIRLWAIHSRVPAAAGSVPG